MHFVKVLLFVALASCCHNHKVNQNVKTENMKYEVATFGMGCFWCGQKKFDKVDGIKQTRVGYLKYEESKTADKKIKSIPTNHVSYCKICSGAAKNYVEVVQVKFDPKVISYKDVMMKFYSFHKPTEKDRQGKDLEDIGFQYKSAIFYHSDEQKNEANKLMKDLNHNQYNNKLKTEIAEYKAENFKQAEWYHQNYWANLASLENTGSVHIKATQWKD